MIKKQLGDFTIKEARKICQKRKECNDCPFSERGTICLLQDVTSLESKDLKKEIEVK